MFWLGVANAGAGLITGAMQGKAAAKLQEKQAELSMRRLAEFRTQQNLQSAQDRRNTSAALFNIQVQNQDAKSQVQLQHAAADTVGASVSDALSTVDVVTDRAASQTKRDYVVGEEERLRQFMSESNAVGEEIKAGYDNVLQQQRSLGMSAALGIATAAAGDKLEKLGGEYADSKLKGQSFTSALSTAFGSYLKK